MKAIRDTAEKHGAGCGWAGFALMAPACTAQSAYLLWRGSVRNNGKDLHDGVLEAVPSLVGSFLVFWFAFGQKKYNSRYPIRARTAPRRRGGDCRDNR